MIRFLSLRRVTLLALAVTLIAACQSDKSVFQWQLQSQATGDSIDFVQLQAMTDNLRVMSQGRLDITALPGGTLTNGADIYDAVKERRVEMGNGWPNWWAGHHPAWAVMNAGPYEFMNLDASMMFFIAGDGTDLANELTAKDGIIWRPAWWSGMEFGLLSKEPITGLADLTNKKVRIGPGLPSEALAQASGAFAIPLVPEEIRPALENGDLDAVEWTTTSGAWNLGLGDLAKYAIVPAIWQPAVLADFLINQQAYDELPEDLQRMLMTSLEAYALKTTAIAKTQDFNALIDFQNNGTEMVTWSDDDLAIWKTVSDQIHQQYAEDDAFSKKVLDAKGAFREKYNHYYDVFGPYD